MGVLGELTGTDRRFLKLSVPVAAFIAALCCFSPVVIVLLGIGSVSYAASLNDVLYGEYWWVFLGSGSAFLIGAFVVHLYANEDVCSVDTAVQKRRKILNLLGLTVALGALAYVGWMLAVELLGMAFGVM